MNDYELQDRYRVMTDDEIISGRDKLGALLPGHDLTGWWTGSQLTIEESRALVPGQNATTLQVAASILGAISWIIANPGRGLCTPEDVDHEPVLQVADLYLGNCPSLQTGWTPLANLAAHPLANPKPAADPWQFKSFLVS
jgi:homospermidine synthase